MIEVYALFKSPVSIWRLLSCFLISSRKSSVCNNIALRLKFQCYSNRNCIPFAIMFGDYKILFTCQSKLTNLLSHAICEISVFLYLFLQVNKYIHFYIIYLFANENEAIFFCRTMFNSFHSMSTYYKITAF